MMSLFENIPIASSRVMATAEPPIATISTAVSVNSFLIFFDLL